MTKCECCHKSFNKNTEIISISSNKVSRTFTYRCPRCSHETTESITVTGINPGDIQPPSDENTPNSSGTRNGLILD